MPFTCPDCIAFGKPATHCTWAGCQYEATDEHGRLPALPPLPCICGASDPTDAHLRGCLELQSWEQSR